MHETSDKIDQISPIGSAVSNYSSWPISDCGHYDN
jgi:hypothetical protein